ncbi:MULTISPECIES: DUF3888 domain-containing protein [Bacillaceae]|uniref:DUF3888 domain-containing protein n=1 Tax=Evansella alkalicola TaxID=745819 RepID=A0ABS6JXC0_9BACI|nr:MULTISPECIES: DUF3888 domain-containing protein [Bacillaceae]MBU9722872.1 DUF3888 domain-containing protein [Bacillus alkalicola]
MTRRSWIIFVILGAIVVLSHVQADEVKGKEIQLSPTSTNEVIQTFGRTEDGYAPLDQDPFSLENESHQNEILSDVFLTMLSPTFSSALQEYYKEPVQFDLYNTDIIELARFQHKGENEKSKHYDFHVMIRLKPYSETNEPLGISTLTLNIKPSEIIVVDLVHEDI